MKKWIFALGVGIRKYWLQLHLFQKLNSDGSFHVLEDYQPNFLYWLQHP